MERHFEIERQKAEIEKLQTVKKHINTVIYSEVYNLAFQKALEQLYDNANAKTEAIKEFAERLRKKVRGKYIGTVYEYEIDNLEKELIKETVGEG